jgi:hypothetical protein
MNNIIDQLLFNQYAHIFFGVCTTIYNLIPNTTIKDESYELFQIFVANFKHCNQRLFKEIYDQRRDLILLGTDTWIHDDLRMEYEFGSVMITYLYSKAIELSPKSLLHQKLIHPLLEIFLLICPNEDMSSLRIYRDNVGSVLMAHMVDNIIQTCNDGITEINHQVSDIVDSIGDRIKMIL